MPVFLLFVVVIRAGCGCFAIFNISSILTFDFADFNICRASSLAVPLFLRVFFCSIFAYVRYWTNLKPFQIMAKSNSFFGLRRGSTRSHTYQVGRTADGTKQQVTKDRVTDVTNPRTAAQQLQRMYFASVSFLRRIFRVVVDNSFESLPWGLANLSKFTSESIRLFSRAFSYSSPYVYGVADSAQTVVAPMVLSQGTIPALHTDYTPATPEEEGGVSPSVLSGSISLGVFDLTEIQSSSFARSSAMFQALRRALGVSPDAEAVMLTAVGIECAYGNAIAEPSHYHSQRLTFKADSAFTQLDPERVLVSPDVFEVSVERNTSLVDYYSAGARPAGNSTTIAASLRVEPVEGQATKRAAYLDVVYSASYDTTAAGPAGYRQTIAEIIVSDDKGRRSPVTARLRNLSDEERALDAPYYDEAVASWPVGDDVVLNGGDA